MENKPKRFKLPLNNKKLSERFAELSIDPSHHQKQSMSISLTNSLKKLHTKTQVRLKPSIYSPKISIGFLPSSSSKKSLHRHGNSVGLSPSTRNLSKDRVPAPDSKMTSPKAVLKLFKNELTELERAEILDYQDIYYFGKIANKVKPKIAAINNGFDDQRGDYLMIAGDHIAYRYEILNLLGKGNFGQVVLCHDHKRNEKVALKVIRNKKRFNQQAGVEIKVLQTLRENDLEGKNHVVKIKNFFVFRKHVCITFEKLSMNLYELLHQNNFQGFSVSLVQKFTQQILQCLDFAYRFKIIHCDLKPENVMLVNSNSAEVHVIDFGSSCFEPERLYTYIQSRFYRAPEIILGIPYTTAIDMWSLGCMVIEFFTGFPAFIGENEHEQLYFFMEILGLPPDNILKLSSRSKLFFDPFGVPTPLEVKKAERIPGSLSLRKLLNGAPESLISFVEKCVVWDPMLRMTPSEGLSHPFIKSKRKGHKPRSKNNSTSIN
jgi:dual specificity tyrosine-phosphorylation-regulated kinase 2/3/4